MSQLANGPDAVPALKRKVKELFDLNQQMRYELDRTEDMRKAQVAINKELHVEITALEQLKLKFQYVNRLEEELRLAHGQLKCPPPPPQAPPPSTGLD